ncbi:MAG TPA: aminotransferase class V-fold PLP-dependent enzyme [Xanthomonadales bacterium]|nr:aminotransferase class V-fold PLP-dependent enzyme [Xanthomonadales bacterium]
MPARSAHAGLWGLDPSVAFLNHGSFGACPREVLEHQSALRARMEAEPVDFFVRDLPGLYAAARESLAAFVHADPDDLAFVSNATSGVAAVLGSIALSPGDELLTTDHAYAACAKALHHAAARSGARVVVARVPFPLSGDDDVVAPILAAATPRTRLALVDHVTSPTALVFPIERIVRELAARGIDVLVDAAHALGMLPLDLDRVGAAYTVCNAHKWLCAPKGSAFLHVRRDRQATLHPHVISHGYEPGAPAARFRDEFDWTGTCDPTPWLCVPEALRCIGAMLPGGWPAVMARNRALALDARARVAAAIGATLPAPAAMIGSMASLVLPTPAPGSSIARLDRVALGDAVRARGVEAWFHPRPGGEGMLVRVSAQLYNDESQYAALGALLHELARDA